MARRKAKFPEIIFVDREREAIGSGEYLVVFEEIEATADMSGTKEIAVYALKEIKKVSVRVEIK